jgi:hypothetical protein
MADRPKRKRKVQKRKHAEPAAPSVGIFFLVGNKLLIDHTPVPEGEIYGDFRIHERGHDMYWETLKKTGVVTEDSEVSPVKAR